MGWLHLMGQLFVMLGALGLAVREVRHVQN